MTVGSQSYSIEVGDPWRSPLTVVVDGESFRVAVQPLEATGEPSAASGEPSSSGAKVAPEDEETQVTAPMPGTVLDIAVQAGTRVEKDQTLCTLEAMKMKTPLRALRAATVRQVSVHDGQTVEHGELLFVLD
jgi:biotin carboxyl carrier protein